MRTSIHAERDVVIKKDAVGTMHIRLMGYSPSDFVGTEARKYTGFLADQSFFIVIGLMWGVWNYFYFVQFLATKMFSAATFTVVNNATCANYTVAASTVPSLTVTAVTDARFGWHTLAVVVVSSMIILIYFLVAWSSKSLVGERTAFKRLFTIFEHSFIMANVFTWCFWMTNDGATFLISVTSGGAFVVPYTLASVAVVSGIQVAAFLMWVPAGMRARVWSGLTSLANRAHKLSRTSRASRDLVKPTEKELVFAEYCRVSGQFYLKKGSDFAWGFVWGDWVSFYVIPSLMYKVSGQVPTGILSTSAVAVRFGVTLLFGVLILVFRAAGLTALKQQNVKQCMVECVRFGFGFVNAYVLAVWLNFAVDRVFAHMAWPTLVGYNFLYPCYGFEHSLWLTWLVAFVVWASEWAYGRAMGAIELEHAHPLYSIFRDAVPVYGYGNMVFSLVFTFAFVWAFWINNEFVVMLANEMSAQALLRETVWFQLVFVFVGSVVALGMYGFAILVASKVFGESERDGAIGDAEAMAFVPRDSSVECDDVDSTSAQVAEVSPVRVFASARATEIQWGPPASRR